MVIHLGPVPVLSPAETLGIGRRVVAWAGEVVDLGARLPGRVDALLDEVTRLLGVLDAVATRAEALVARADALVADVDGVVVAARAATGGAAEVVAGAGTTSAAAQELLGLYRPMLERGAPMAGRFVEELSDDEVEAAIRLVDQMPRLTEHMITDIMPILETLDRVGPDLHDLLETTKELRQAVDGIPGLTFLKRRGSRGDDER